MVVQKERLVKNRVNHLFTYGSVIKHIHTKKHMFFFTLINVFLFNSDSVHCFGIKPYDRRKKGSNGIETGNNDDRPKSVAEVFFEMYKIAKKLLLILHFKNRIYFILSFSFLLTTFILFMYLFLFKNQHDLLNIKKILKFIFARLLLNTISGFIAFGFAINDGIYTKNDLLYLIFLVICFIFLLGIRFSVIGERSFLKYKLKYEHVDLNKVSTYFLFILFFSTASVYICFIFLSADTFIELINTGIFMYAYLSGFLLILSNKILGSTNTPLLFKHFWAVFILTLLFYTSSIILLSFLTLVFKNK